MNTAQQYCLRWNNHRTNLLRVFDELLQNEAFTDVTIVCDGANRIKCHKMVLAACSPYFQELFTDLPCKHPVVVLKDVKYFEIKAILEYMYRGEVNVAQNQLAALLKVAEALKVKGLVEENRPSSNTYRHDEPMEDSPTSLSTNSSMNMVHSSSNNSPPHSTYKTSPYPMYPNANKHQDRSPGGHLPLWAVPGHPLPPSASMPSPNHHNTLLSNYETNEAAYHPHRRKKFSSASNIMMNKDTPILRTVLGQGQADSSQPVSLVCHADSRDSHENGGETERLKKHMKNEPLEDAQSPYTDFSSHNDEDIKPNMAVPSSSPQSYSNEMQDGVTSGIASYVQATPKEWKRYKQYSRDEIMAAINDVRNGMSALQAARKYNVPSRTLYDKVKKLGITTSRPFKRGSNGSPAGAKFPYMLSSTTGGLPYPLSESDEPMMNNNSALLEATFLQHALDGRGGGDEALRAMAAAAAAHAAAAASARSTSPSNHGLASSPSPSPTLLKYMQHHSNSMTPSPNGESDNHHSETNGSSERDNYDDDHVEDLSVSRKPDGVIVPPMNQVSTIMKKDDIIKECRDNENNVTIEKNAA